MTIPFKVPPTSRPPKPTEIICKCNGIRRSEIEQAILDGAKTLNEIFDATMAGVGPCGGSCRRIMGPMLDHYLETGTLMPPTPTRFDKK